MSTKTEIVITPKRKLLDLQLGVVWKYKSLIYMLIKRDFVTYYKQTIFGPLWYLFQPICSTIMYMLVFGNLAGIGTDSIPQPLFYFTGTILWTFFSENMLAASKVFATNKDLFGKVYFPRLVVPIANTVVNWIKLGIQLMLFIVVYIYYIITSDVVIPDIRIFLFIPVIGWLSILSLGIGMIISSITSKYKDIAMALTYFVSLLMYAAPVVYPISELEGKLKTVICLNPVTAAIEVFRYSLFGVTDISSWAVIYSITLSMLICILGLIVFNRNEQSFIDVI